MKKLVVWMLTLMLCLTGIALAEGDVAQIGTIGYATFDAAVAAAKDGATITLLSDCTTNGLNLSKSLTVEGERHTLTFRDSGIALRGKTLTFKNCQVVMNKIGKTPDAEWNWMSICASKTNYEKSTPPEGLRRKKLAKGLGLRQERTVLGEDGVDDET